MSTVHFYLHLHMYIIRECSVQCSLLFRKSLPSWHQKSWTLDLKLNAFLMFSRWIIPFHTYYLVTYTKRNIIFFHSFLHRRMQHWIGNFIRNNRILYSSLPKPNVNLEKWFSQCQVIRLRIAECDVKWIHTNWKKI